MTSPTNITDDELATLERCRSEPDWNQACERIKAARGQYPDDWFERVLLSGLMARVASSFR